MPAPHSSWQRYQLPFLPHPGRGAVRHEQMPRLCRRAGIRHGRLRLAHALLRRPHVDALILPASGPRGRKSPGFPVPEHAGRKNIHGVRARSPDACAPSSSETTPQKGRTCPRSLPLFPRRERYKYASRAVIVPVRRPRAGTARNHTRTRHVQNRFDKKHNPRGAAYRA